MPDLASNGKQSVRGSLKAKETCECVIRVVRVSGTMRKVEMEAVRRAKGMVGRILGEEEGADLNDVLSMLGGEVDVLDRDVESEEGDEEEEDEDEE